MPIILDKHQVQNFIKINYNLEGNLYPLPSYYDQNFLLDNSKSKFVIKISNNLRTKENLETENKILDYLHLDNVSIPKIKKNVSGFDIATFEGVDSTIYIRVFEYIEGEILSSIETVNDELLNDIGNICAKINKQLSKVKIVDKADSLWDLRNAKENLRFSTYLKDINTIKIVEKILTDFDYEFKKYENQLEPSPIHGDLNLANLIYKDNKIIGVLDFGEIKNSYKIFDPAIACMYPGLKNQDPIASFTSVINGYNQVSKINSAELDLIYPAICARVCVSTIISFKNSAEFPDNEYVKAKCAPNMLLLKKISEISFETGKKLIKDSLVS